MSEEYKISVPLFENGELETFDNNIHSIVEEYSKMMFKEKDQILTQRIIMKQEEEIKELQDQLQQQENIIKEVREWVVKNSFSNGISSSIFFMPNAYANELLEILDKDNK